MQPLHSNFAVSIRGRISSVFLTIPSADTKFPMYLLNKSLNLVNVVSVLASLIAFLQSSVYSTVPILEISSLTLSAASLSAFNLAYAASASTNV